MENKKVKNYETRPRNGITICPGFFFNSSSQDNIEKYKLKVTFFFYKKLIIIPYNIINYTNKYIILNIIYLIVK